MLRLTVARTFSTAAKGIQNGVPRLEYFPGRQAIDKNRSFLSQNALPRMTAGLRSTWLTAQLITIGKLLMDKRGHDAYEHAITTLSITQTADQRQYFSRAIRMFIKVGDYERAINFINHLTEHGYEIPLSLYLQLLSGKNRHDRRHLEQVLNAIARFDSLDSIPDDLDFLAVLSAAVKCKSPDEILQLFELRCRARRYWVPSVKSEVLGLVIAAYSKALDTEGAKHVLLSHMSPPSDSPATAARPLSVLISLLKQKDISHPRDRSHEEVRLHLESRTWPTSSFKLGGPIRERTPECYPYTALLQGYQRSELPLLEDVYWVLDQMVTQGVAIDAEFCNALAKTLVHWKMNDVALGIYHAMMENPDFPLPSISTSRKGFLAWKRKQEISYSPSTLGRNVFRDMMLLEDVKPRPLELTHWHYLDLRNLNAAVNTFIRGRDFAAAIVAKDVFIMRYGLGRLNVLKDQSIQDMLARIRTEEQLEGATWADRLFGGRSEALFTECTTRLFNAIQTNSRRFKFDPLAPPNTLQKGSFITQLLLRGLRAQLGFTVPDWGQPMDPADASREILDAQREMIPYMEKPHLKRFMP